MFGLKNILNKTTVTENPNLTDIKTKKVLIVEDEQIISNMYQTLLNNHGFEVIVASNGEEGLKKIIEVKPNLILLDIMMPIMDGKQMLNKLQNASEYVNYKNIPVIMLTNAGSVDNMRDTRTLGGAAEFLIKSNVKPEEILNIVSKYFSV